MSLRKAVGRRAKVDVIYPDVPTDETKGGSNEGSDDIHLDVLLPDSHALLSSHGSGVAEKNTIIGHLAQEEGRGEAEDEEEGASQQKLQSAAALNMSFRCMVEAREQLEKDLAGVVTNPSKSEVQKFSESILNVFEAWRKTKLNIQAAATALKEMVQKGQMVESAEFAIEFAKLTRTILVELRTLPTALREMGGKIAKRELCDTLEEGRKKLQREAEALKERLASDPDVIFILVKARETLVQDCKAFLANPNPRDETWKGCAAHLLMLVDAWSKAGKAIMVAVEELRAKASDEDLIGGAKSAVVFAKLLRGAVSELLELLRALQEIKQLEGRMEGRGEVVEAALEAAERRLNATRAALLDSSAEQILERAELQQLRAESAVDEGGALLDFVNMVLSGASIVPGLASVCTALKAVVGVAQAVHKLASDALEMTASVFEIGRYLIDLRKLAKRMTEQIDAELDHHMGGLAKLVSEMKMAIEAFWAERIPQKDVQHDTYGEAADVHRAEEEGDTRGHRPHHPECPD